MENKKFSQVEIDKLKPLSHNAKIMLVIGGLFSIATGLSGTFVNIYLWKSKQDFAMIGIFNLFHYLFIPLAFILGGWIAKKKNNTLSLRLGVLFHGLFFLTILLLRGKTPDYIIPMGIFLGVAAGFYWVAANTLTFDVTTRFNRDTYNSFTGMIMSLSGMSAPLISSYIIVAFPNLTGYQIVFGISLGLFLVICLISLLLKLESYHEPYDLISTFKEMASPWKYTLLGQVFFGIRNGVLLFFINLLVYVVTQNEVNIGKLSLVTAGVSSITFWGLERWLKPSKRIGVFKGGAVMMLVSVIFLVFKINLLTIFAFGIVNSVFAPFFTVTFNSAALNIIDKSHHDKQRIECIVLQEIALNAGRLIGVIAFILVLSRWYSQGVIRAFLLVIGSMQLILLLFTRKMDFDEDIV